MRITNTLSFNLSKAPLADVLEQGANSGFPNIISYFTSESSRSRYSPEGSLRTSPKPGLLGFTQFAAMRQLSGQAIG